MGDWTRAGYRARWLWPGAHSAVRSIGWLVACGSDRPRMGCSRRPGRCEQAGRDGQAMSDRYAQVIILAEDERSANLLRRYVQRALDLNPRGLRQEISPSGRGDAKDWVLARYPTEV